MYQGTQRIWSLKKSVPQPISCWMGSSWPLTVINLTLTRYWGISFGFYLLAGKVLFNSVMCLLPGKFLQRSLLGEEVETVLPGKRNRQNLPATRKIELKMLICWL
jgi:hypothetical protein